MEEIVLDIACLEKVVNIGIVLAPELQSQIVEVIQQFHIVFMWWPKDMPVIDCDIIIQTKLAVDPTKKPVQ